MAQRAVQEAIATSVEELVEQYPGEWVLVEVERGPDTPSTGSTFKLLSHSRYRSRVQKRFLAELECHRHLPPEERPRWHLFEAIRPVSLAEAIPLVEEGIAAPRGIRNW